MPCKRRWRGRLCTGGSQIHFRPFDEHNTCSTVLCVCHCTYNMSILRACVWCVLVCVWCVWCVRACVCVCVWYVRVCVWCVRLCVCVRVVRVHVHALYPVCASLTCNRELAMYVSKIAPNLPMYLSEGLNTSAT